MRILKLDEFPELLQQIHKPPKQLWVEGSLPNPTIYRYLCVVGSRRHSAYGKDACRELIAGLVGYPIVVVSGLALGIDALAHRTAIELGIPTVAFPGSGLDDDVLYPAQHLSLAKEIIKSGGALVSEFSPNTESAHWTFPQRNRLMAGIAHAIIIIEGEERSGTHITANYALDYNRDIMAVPGSIFSPQSKGTHALIREGAALVTSSKDILEVLGFHGNLGQKLPLPKLSQKEQKILHLCSQKISKSELLRSSDMPLGEVNALISEMEIKGWIRESDGFIMRLR